jgi:hypothetical protein
LLVLTVPLFTALKRRKNMTGGDKRVSYFHSAPDGHITAMYPLFSTFKRRTWKSALIQYDSLLFLLIDSFGLPFFNVDVTRGQKLIWL